MKGVCTTCAGVSDNLASCSICDGEIVLELYQFLDSSMRISSATGKKSVLGSDLFTWRHIHEIPYSELKDTFWTLIKKSSLQLNHTLHYYIGVKEYEMVDKIPLEGLPLHIGDNLISDIGKEYLRHRLTGEGEVEHPGKEYYLNRYLLKEGG